MKFSHLTPVQIIVLFIVAVYCGGCANYSAVRTYAEETKKLTVATEPMLSGSKVICVEKFKRKKLISSENYNATEAEKKANDVCGTIDEQNKIIAELNKLLENYAEILTALADEKLPVYKTELDGLSTSLGKIKRAGTTESELDQKKLTAISSLLNFLGKEITKYTRGKAIEELLDKEDEIVIIANTLITYAKSNYQAYNSDAKREIDLGLNKALEDAKKTEPLASNYLSSLLAEEEKNIEERKKANDLYIAALENLKTAHKKLKSTWKTPENEDLLKELGKYANDIFLLQKQLSDAF